MINDSLLVYRDPEDGNYRTILTLGRSDSISPPAFRDLKFQVEYLLGDAVTE